MRQNERDASRTEFSQDILQIDFHDFIQLSVWMDDVELAQEFHIGLAEAEALNRKIRRV